MKKEAVKQWIIQELISKLNYPEQMIEMEYPVRNSFGWDVVDIAVHHWNKEEAEPYILISFIQSKRESNTSIKKLKSYITCMPSVCYAVVTDGFSIYMEKKQGKTFIPVKELPVYEEKNQNRFWIYEYRNLKNQCKYEYRVARENGEEIQIWQKDYQELLNDFHYCMVPIIGTVAAGTMKPALQEYMGEIRLPKEFGVEKGESFALKVRGDSMSDFDISTEDYVIIHQQNYAKQGDIVIAGERTEDEVTIKKYFLSGESVLLIPGNRQYEPIQLPVEKTFLNGVLIGVMKPISNE